MPMTESASPWKVRSDGPTGRNVRRFDTEADARRFANSEWRRRRTDGGTIVLYRYNTDEDVYEIAQSTNIRKG